MSHTKAELDQASYGANLILLTGMVVTLLGSYLLFGIAATILAIGLMLSALALLLHYIILVKS